MDIFEAIHGRRSIRKFANKPVLKNDLIKILNAARLAPSGGNLQAWRFIVIENKSIISEMATIIKERIDGLTKLGNKSCENSAILSNLQARFRFSSLFFQYAPVTIAVQVGENPYIKPVLHYLKKNGLDSYEAYRLLGFVEVQSGSAAIENLVLAAHSLGYGTCWMNVPFIALKEVEKLLGVEDPWQLIALVPLGVPDRACVPVVPKKKQLEEIVTFLN